MKNSCKRSIGHYGWIDTMSHIKNLSFKKLQTIKEKKEGE